MIKKIFPKDGHIRFIRQPWWNTYYILKRRHFSLQFGYNIPGWQLGNTPGEKGPLHIRRKFMIDRLVSAYKIELPTVLGVDPSLAQLRVDNVPEEYWVPHLIKPSNKELMKMFYQESSEFVYNVFKQYLKSTNPSELDGRLMFLEKILKICEDKYNYDYLKIGLVDKGLRAKIFTEDDHKAWNFRKSVFDWLSSRGAYTLTLEYEYSNHFKEIILTPEDFKNYFKDDFAQIAISFEKVKTFNEGRMDQKISDVKEKLRLMQNFIIEILDFVKEMAEIAGGKLIFYTFNIFENGYGIDRNAMNYLPETIPENEYEWKLRTASTYKDTAFIFDLNDPTSIRKFEEQIPVFLANFLVKPACFVVRNPDMIQAVEPLTTKNYEYCWFSFTPFMSLLPSQIVGHHTPSKSSYNGPPRDGMKWIEGFEEDYVNWVYTKGLMRY